MKKRTDNQPEQLPHPVAGYEQTAPPPCAEMPYASVGENQSDETSDCLSYAEYDLGDDFDCTSFKI